MQKPLTALALLCAILPLAGCSTLPWQAPPTQLASNTLAGVPVVHNSDRKRVDGSWDIPCPTQREIAELNTYLGSATGTLQKDTTYAAKCELNPIRPASKPVS